MNDIKGGLLFLFTNFLTTGQHSDENGYFHFCYEIIISVVHHRSVLALQQREERPAHCTVQLGGRRTLGDSISSQHPENVVIFVYFKVSRHFH